MSPSTVMPLIPSPMFTGLEVTNHESQPRVPPHLRSGIAPADPEPFGSFIKTGAPCSETVLLRGIIKRQEDIGAQTLE